MAKIISFANQKGGVGKTTTVHEVGELLAGKFDKRVLLIDNDPQGSLTQIKADIHQIIDSHAPTMTEVYLGAATLKDIIIPVKDSDGKVKPNLDLAPTTLTLSDAELNLVNATLRELILEKALAPVKDSYDYILIDCPPSRGLLTVNALASSDYVIVPVQAEYQALLGMQLLKNTVKSTQSVINSNLKVAGYVLTMVSRTNHSKEVSEEVKKDIYDVIGSIPRAVDVADAEVANLSVVDYNPDNKAGTAYLELTRKIMELGDNHGEETSTN
ncbi:ParA family protein [Secundilactobacillus kimchicus]|uniref:ParA family protein n=1 Tax=Secundilactobacillus kimchicus TaxID=528209 RepID=UPI002078EACC|nr:AAA family ATPase [Secundilactobacillus kimchicus]